MFGRLTNRGDKAAKAATTSGRRVSNSPSVIAEGMCVLGNIISDGPLDIDGKIEGNVRAHTISVRMNGYIRGDVTADTVHVYGHIDGLVKARNVTLYSTGKVSGNVMYESLSIEDGATIDGKSKRTEYQEPDAEALEEARRLHTPSLDSPIDEEPESDEPQSEEERQILQSLRLIS